MQDWNRFTHNLPLTLMKSGHEEGEEASLTTVTDATQLVKKTQQRLHFVVWHFTYDPQQRLQLHPSMDCKPLQRVMRTAEKITVGPLHQSPQESCLHPQGPRFLPPDLCM